MLCESSWVYNSKSNKSRAIQSDATLRSDVLVSGEEPWRQMLCKVRGAKDLRMGSKPTWQSCLASKQVNIKEKALHYTLLGNNQLTSLFAPYSKCSFEATLTFHFSPLACMNKGFL